MSKRSKGRKLDGIIILDKPAGLTSNRLLQAVKRLFDASKAGHTGSLDPLATGVLPLCFGEATKVSQYLLDSDKSYIAHIKLGEATTTGDKEGELTATNAVPELSENDLLQVLSTFIGQIEQVPSIYSALKQDGVPLYKLARAGKEIKEKRRTITIYDIKLIHWQSPELCIEVLCSKGTYIRTLAEDLGKAIGCGGHITALRRNKAGPFTLDDAHTLESLQQYAEKGDVASMDAFLKAPDLAIDWMPSLTIDGEQSLLLQQGQKIQLSSVGPIELVRVYALNQFIGIGTVDAASVLQVVRLMHCPPSKKASTNL